MYSPQSDLEQTAPHRTSRMDLIATDEMLRHLLVGMAELRHQLERACGEGVIPIRPPARAEVRRDRTGARS